jgi:oxygen-independent coproporphyrinogen-3 oxidase
MKRAALYLHFPYCRSRCTYCDFNAYADVGAERSSYIQALIQDIRSQDRWRIHSVFCGGGTPSLYSAEELAAVLQACREHFDFRPVETTLEANPGTVSLEQLRGLRQAGFDRISLGVQTFEPELLKVLNRIHSVADVENAVGWARQAGFENLSLDLIYGLPGQSMESWQNTVQRALGLQPDHISTYQLTVEPGTRLESQVRLGEVQLPDEDLVYEMDRWMRGFVRGSGLRRYEVSNWARAGRESRHNLVYWKDLPYLGLGCGATGFVNGWRVRRVLHPVAYERMLAAGALPVVSAERRDLEGGLRDCLMMGLRVRQGVKLPRLLRRFPGLTQKTLEAFFQGFPASWWSLTETRLRLRGRGVDFVSTICEELMEFLLIQPALADPGAAKIENASLAEVAAVVIP